MAITKATYPELHAALVEIECDNGGHLIGAVYPGTPINLNRFKVPDAYWHLLAPAEVALARLRQTNELDWYEFVCGEETASEAIQRRQGDLMEASALLEAWFNGWPEPAITVSTTEAP